MIEISALLALFLFLEPQLGVSHHKNSVLVSITVLAILHSA